MFALHQQTHLGSPLRGGNRLEKLSDPVRIEPVRQRGQRQRQHSTYAVCMRVRIPPLHGDRFVYFPLLFQGQ